MENNLEAASALKYALIKVTMRFFFFSPRYAPSAAHHIWRNKRGVCAVRLDFGIRLWAAKSRIKVKWAMFRHERIGYYLWKILSDAGASIWKKSRLEQVLDVEVFHSPRNGAIWKAFGDLRTFLELQHLKCSKISFKILRAALNTAS